MTSSIHISDLQGIKWNLYFQKAHNKSYPNIQFLLILDKHCKRYGNISEIWPLFGMGHWSYHVTQGKNLSFSYSRLYYPLNFRKVTKLCGSVASLTEVIKKAIWGRVESPRMWSRVKSQWLGLNKNIDKKLQQLQNLESRIPR